MLFLATLALFIFVIWGVCKFFEVVFDNWSSVAALITTLATTGGAIATWMAAKRAAESAQIARESMEATMHLGSQTLEETQTTNRRTAFESRYTMLLTQHDNYHRQLCDYLDENNDDVEAFFSEKIYDTTLDTCFSFLTGHQIISRYMRVLYHLLKYVRENCDFSGKDNVSFQKNYTSPLRSTIRNDVLLLIAVNALNVKDERAKSSSYPYYQQLLHDFEFFEHAIFMFPRTPNELFMRDDWQSNVHDLVLNVQSHFDENLKKSVVNKSRSFEVPDIRLFSPMVMVITVFDNPMKNTAFHALNSLPVHLCLREDLHERINEVSSSHRYAKKFTENLAGSEYTTRSNTTPRKINEEIMSEMDEKTFSDNCVYDGYYFKLFVLGVYEKASGQEIRGYLKEYKRAMHLERLIEKYHSIEGYMRHMTQLNQEKVADFICNEIADYDVRTTQ